MIYIKKKLRKKDTFPLYHLGACYQLPSTNLHFLRFTSSSIKNCLLLQHLLSETISLAFIGLLYLMQHQSHDPRNRPRAQIRPWGRGWGQYQQSCRDSSVQFSFVAQSDSLQPHEQQHTRPPCPSPISRVCQALSERICCGLNVFVSPQNLYIED